MTLTKPNYKQRLIDKEIERCLHIFGAVCVEGPKWCGKTWTSLNHANSVIFLDDPSSNFEKRRLVQTSLDLAFVGDEPHLIDEWQEIPEIWDATRHKVDESSARGRFILTGSSTPKRKGIHHSGAGRMGTITMRTMSLFESGDSTGAVSLKGLFNGEFAPSFVPKPDLDQLISLTVRGGWPQNIGLAANDALQINKEYLKLAINDVATLDGKHRSKEKIQQLIRSLARNESTFASNQKILSDVSENPNGVFSIKTLTDYLDALDRLFLLDNQAAFAPNIRTSVRVGKMVKRHFIDPALAIAALKLNVEKLHNDLITYGFMFESMCERDLQIYAAAAGGSLFHYRDGDGREIDAIVEMPDGQWGAFEIKLGANQIDAAADNLLKIKSFFEKNGSSSPSVLCVICGILGTTYQREDGVYVVPITALKD